MRRFFEDASLKIISLGGALLLWYFVTTNIRSVELLVPYEIIGVPQNKILVSSYEDKVKIRLSGPSFILKSVQSSYPVFKVEVPRGLQQDSYLATFSAADLGLPSAVQVLNIEPKQVELRFDTRVWKEVPIEVPRIGVLDPDYSLSSLRVEPNRVRLQGPGSQLLGVEQVETFPLQMRDVVRSPDQVLGLRLPSGLVEAAVSSVKVSVDISPIVVTKTFEKVPVQLNSKPGWGGTVEPGVLRVRLSGPRFRLRNLTQEEIQATLRLPEESGTFEVKPDVSIPKGLTLLSVEPTEVLVVVAGKSEEATISSATASPAP